MSAPLVIPYFIPHQGCPHQCVFCNQSIITGRKPADDHENIDQVIREYLSFKGSRSRVEFAFFGGNFLGLPMEKIQSLLDRIKPYLDKGLIQSVRCSTRPDTITREILDLVVPFGLDLVELGVQSMDDDVLNRAGRGHTRKDTLEAVGQLRAAGLKFGVQVMAGLPGDTMEGALATTRDLAGLRPDLARIYPVLVMAGSRLAQWHESGQYSPLSLDHAIEHVKEMVKVFHGAGVPVVRMGLQASEMMDDPDQVLAGPWHPAFGHLIHSALMLDQVCEQLDILLEKSRADQVRLHVHPRSLSRLQGDKKMNLEKLARQYPGIKLSITRDKSLALDRVKVFPLD